MSFNEIKDLRKDGKLEEALELANRELSKNPEDIWNKRAAAWVYYEYLKKYAQPDSYDAFKENLFKLNELQLPEDEKMVFDNTAWQIGSMVFGLKKKEPVDFEKIDELFEVIKEFHFTKPSEAYSFIYKAFHKGYQNWSKYLDFAYWWNFENFRPEDYLKEEFKDKKLMSIAEQAYIAYSKKLLEGDAVDSFEQQRAVDKEKIRAFLPLLDKVIDERPEYQYPPYFKAKLLLALGDEENILSSFIPFAKQKRNDFWVWEVMAEIFPDNKEIQFACYCKALSLNTPEEFLVKLRQTFAAVLIEREMYKDAKAEVLNVITTRLQEGWKLPNQITQWTEQDWFKTTPQIKDNKELYKQHAPLAEEILFQDIPEEVVAVEFVNEQKKILNFVQSRERFGFFKYQGFVKKPSVGDLFKVRLEKKANENFYRLLTLEKANPKRSKAPIQLFSGNFKQLPERDFGFVDDVFIGPQLVSSYKLTNGQAIKGKAVLSYNKKKESWGWKAFEVTPTSN